ncbi:MAG TPA: POTRA domain-containing protein, partial [Exilispira sp.]|nr:POTRA domain-containing protein [Exilispira sp.]
LVSEDDKVNICLDKVKRQNIPAGRNNFVLAFAAELCRHGVPVQRALSECLGYQEESFGEIEIKKTVEKIKNLYLDEGYEAPDIEYSVKIDENKQANITFKISEKKRYIIKSINIEGNTVIESKKILKVMQTKKQSKIIFEFNKGIYNQGKIEQDLNSIQNLYWSQGYLDVEVFVKDIKVTETEKEKDIEITISIVENEQYTLNSFAFYGNKLFDLVAFLDPKITNPGVVYNKIAIANLANRIRDYYANYGYVFAIVEVEETINYSDKKVDIVISISENSRAHIEKIIIKGNTKTKDYVIIRELMIQEGETFSTDKIRQSIYNLYNTQYFGAIDVQFQQGSDDELVNLIIAVEETSTGQFKFGATYSPGSDN